MKDILEKVKAYLNSDKFKEDLIKEEEREKVLDNLRDKYIENFHGKTKLERCKIIDAINLKYASDEYINKEYSKSRMPQNNLWYLIFDYGKKYGEPYEDDNNPFPHEAYVIDDEYIAEIMWGQGTECIVRKCK